ncbi:MAG: histidinol-phosphate aminotransferase, partial [Cyanobium sp. MAG_04]|nr:histidinol-phosphate aminotransferase [Cyanobium sp. MAG_04]
MEPQARREVEGLQAYSAPLEGRRGMLRLDFNENTMGPSQHV